MGGRERREGRERGTTHGLATPSPHLIFIGWEMDGWGMVKDLLGN